MNTNYYILVSFYLVLTKKKRKNGLLGYLDPKKDIFIPLIFKRSHYLLTTLIHVYNLILDEKKKHLEF